MSARRDDLIWQEVFWPRPLKSEWATGLLRRLATDQSNRRTCWEVRGSSGLVRFFVATAPTNASDIARMIEDLIPGATVAATPDRGLNISSALRVRVHNQALHLGVSQITETASAILSALAAADCTDEQTAVQVVLGASVAPSLLEQRPADPTATWLSLLFGNNRPATAEMRASMRGKREQFGFLTTVRLGASADSDQRRRGLLLGLLAGLKTLESGEVRMSVKPDDPADLDLARMRETLPLRLSVQEILAVLAWPVGSEPYPGLPEAHPRVLRPSDTLRERSRVFAISTAPSTKVPIGISPADSLFHSLFMGPTGSGKSNALLHLITRDMESGRAVVVIDPKADLVSDVLVHIPRQRQQDVVILDPTQSNPVGLNPLANVTTQNAELVADSILSIFKILFASSWGPRTSDVLHASLLTLAAHGHASLVWLPRLLTDPTFRRTLTSRLNDPIGLEPFWAQYESMSPQQQAQVIGPAMSRLRQLLLRKSLRAVLGQIEPRFALSDVFTKQRILLVPLNKGQLGPEAARLLGSLLVSELWQLTLARASLPASARHTVGIYVDEMQDYLNLPTDLSDALSQSRSLGVAWHLAHQFREQLPEHLRAAVDTNARNKVIFGLGPGDATVMARMAPELEAADFMALRRFEVYASIMSGGESTPWVSGRTLPPPPMTSDPAFIVADSQLRYGARPERESPSVDTAPISPGENEVIGRRKRGQN